MVSLHLKRVVPGLTALVLLLALGLFRLKSNRPPESYSAVNLVMDTYVRVIVAADNRRGAAACQKVFAEFKRIEQLMSSQIPTSLVYRLNSGALRQADDPDLAHVLKTGIEVAKLSGGAFDPTVGALVKLWDVESPEPRVPPVDSIAMALKLVDIGAVKVESTRVSFHKRGIAVDLGGIAKGYAINRGLQLLEGLGIKNALIDAGGDIGIIGERPGGGDWRVGIQHPRNPEKIIGILKMSGGAVATSGDYQRYFMSRGHRYHHIINPKTGWPATPAVSVTVVAPGAETADALATAAFVMNPKQGLDFLEDLPRVEGVIIYNAGTEQREKLDYLLTSGLRDKLRIDLD